MGKLKETAEQTLMRVHDEIVYRKGCGKEQQLFYGDIWYKVKCGDINPIGKERIFCKKCENGVLK